MSTKNTLGVRARLSLTSFQIDNVPLKTKKVTNFALWIPLWVSDLCSHMLGYLYVSVFYSQSRSNWNVGFCIFHGGLHLESFLRTQNFPQCPLLVFSVTPFKIDQNKNQTIRQITFRIWEMKGGKYTKTVAKIWVEGIIRIRDI